MFTRAPRVPTKYIFSPAVHAPANFVHDLRKRLLNLNFLRRSAPLQNLSLFPAQLFLIGFPEPVVIKHS